MAVPKITLFVDTVSPFAYIAYYILRHNPVFKGCDVTYIPVFLGGIMKMCNNTAPINIKNKDKWIEVERLRWAREFAVPMAGPPFPDFPPLTLTIMRALCVLRDRGGDQGQLVAALDLLFHEYWVKKTPTHQPEALRAVLRQLLGAAIVNELFEAVPTDGKRILSENTQKAFDSGAFGLPWVVCTNASGQTEGFWGVDHFGQVTNFLGLERPSQGPWKALL